MSRYYRDPVTGEEIPIDGMRSIQDMKNLMLEICYPIGSIYISTNNVSPETFLGGTWIQHSGYMLRGATSGVNANHTGNDGGADSVTVSSVASHNHTQNEHSHGAYMEFGATANTSYSVYDSRSGWCNQWGKYFKDNKVSNTTATNIANGSNYTVNTLPKYKNVYIWERTA